MRLARWATCATAGALAACASLLGAEDVHYAEDGGADATASDAPAGPDGAGDVPDAGPVDPGDADAKADAPPRFCPPKTAAELPFCLDFDDPKDDLLSGWTRQEPPDGGSALADADSHSPPRSLYVTAGPDGENDTFVRDFVTQLSATTLHLTVAVHVTIALGNTPEIIVVELRQPGGGTPYLFEITRPPAGNFRVFINDGASSPEVQMPQALPVTSGWQVLTMDVDLVKKELALSVDNHNNLPVTFPVNLGAPPVDVLPTVKIGTPQLVGSPANQWEIAFDDLLFDVQ